MDRRKKMDTAAEVKFLIALRGSTNYANWGESKKTGWDLLTEGMSGTDAQSVAPAGVNFDSDGHIDAVVLNDSGLSGTIPLEIGACSRLRCLRLENNDLQGYLEADFPWPSSLKFFQISNNPNLAGQITKALVLQCTIIDYFGCRPKYADYATGRMHERFMQGPYLVGASFASEDLRDLMLGRRALRITDAMVTDVPPIEMGADGEKICPWQKVWLDGLKALKDREVYVMSSTTFKTKFKNHERYADHNENMRRDSFDAGQDLPAGERAFSILDWERRQLQRYALLNRLTIVHLKNQVSGKAPKDRPQWYPDPDEGEREQKPPEIFNWIEDAQAAEKKESSKEEGQQESTEAEAARDINTEQQQQQATAPAASVTAESTIAKKAKSKRCCVQ